MVFVLSKATTYLAVQSSRHLGREPGSSSYERRLMSEGWGLNSQHRLLDGHFFTYISSKIIMFVWKDENKFKEARYGPFI